MSKITGILEPKIITFLLSNRSIYYRHFEIRRTEVRKSQGPAGPGVRQQFLFVYFVLHRKSEMPLVCRNDHGQLRIRFCFK